MTFGHAARFGPAFRYIDPRERRVVPCVCGGTVAADPNDQLLILHAIKRHQMVPRHRAWLAAGGLISPTFDILIRTAR